MEIMIGIQRHPRTNGPAVYAIRGHGPEYKDLYTFLNKCDTVCIYDNWPWDYIFFNKSDEETEFVQKYDQYFYMKGHPEEPWEESTPEPQDPVLEQLSHELFEILQKELSDEINKQIVDEILKSKID
jgi:DNA phosphorothioation-dependent restriction protein DptG